MQPMKDMQLASDPPLSQLLDAVERRLDAIAGAHSSEIDPAAAAQINDAATNILRVLKKADSIKNHFALINRRLPREILAHIAAFFEKERDLINATAICRHWRTILLSFPRLWRNAGGSSSEIRAYVQRSKATQLDVNLSHPSLVDLIVPHTSRLAGLTVRLDKSSSIDQFLNRLDCLVPTLHTFSISAIDHHLGILEFPSGLHSPLFPSLKKLNIDGISAFHGPQLFPYVTELTWRTGRHWPIEMVDFLGTLEQLPSLKRVYVTFHPSFVALVNSPVSVVTLPHVQEMSLVSSPGTDLFERSRFPDILEYLQLPNLTKLYVEPLSMTAGMTRPLIFPSTTLGQKFPNFTELPELHVDMGSREATFRNMSRATLKYRMEVMGNYNHMERKDWKGLPLLSVQRLIVNIAPQPVRMAFKNTWLVGLLKDLKSLKHLELGGECGDAIQWLCGEMMQDKRSIPIKTLCIRCGGHDMDLARWLKRLAGIVGIAATVICVPEPRA